MTCALTNCPAVKKRVSHSVKFFCPMQICCFLDEPTNHLDIESVEWLEDFLRNYSGAFIVISHDRYFLDRVTNKTFELENSRFRSYNGNYSAYMAQREIDKKDRTEKL